MLDLSKYEGHTRQNWLNVPGGVPIFVWLNPEGSDAHLIADAPLLLAEVRRLSEREKAWEKIHSLLIETLGEKEWPDKFTALRQSHARLLAAIKDDPDRLVSDAYLRAAVAEAEAL